MARWRWGFIILAIIALLASCVGPWSATSHSAQMGTSIENALKANALEVVGVDMNGNVATLSGDLASQDLCLLYTSPSPRDATLSRMPSSA